MRKGGQPPFAFADISQKSRFFTPALRYLPRDVSGGGEGGGGAVHRGRLGGHEGGGRGRGRGGLLNTKLFKDFYNIQLSKDDSKFFIGWQSL